MHLINALHFTLLLAGLVAANGRKGISSNPSILDRRQVEYCQGTCVGCFGPGNVKCTYNSCYNPSAGEQCCSDGTYCTGPDTSCCGTVGAGETDIPDTAPATVSVATSTTGPFATQTTSGRTVPTAESEGTAPATSSVATSTIRPSGTQTTSGRTMSTTASEGAAAVNVVDSIAALALGVVGLAML
ncbi:hypothetical protein H2199_008971 [Coniosporium tulheliwenetii]|uniref:Uncharacterized protein n=1 Tax=Coniosporium tulheliwenetii TaxID=3383036 RepID=A0ACC2YHE9_9PEZI|nr:hypothetical protein H2199_008971 [Cladosporium sp. JES 115]